MIKKSLFAALILGLGVLLVPREPARGTEGNKVLLFPVLLQGDFQPRSEQEFTQAILNQARKMAPKANIIVARPQDMAGLRSSSGTQPPNPEEAARLCAAYGANHACWLSLRFTPEFVNGSNSVLTVAGAARMWAFEVEGRRVLVDEPISVVRTMPAGNRPSDEQLQPMAEKLSSQCMNQLAQEVVALGKQSANRQLVQSWAKPVAAPKAASNAEMKRMADCIERYKKAVDSGDLIASTDRQRQALVAWRDLSDPEQKQIEQMYPGTWQWMEGGFYYDTGNYWYPTYPRPGGGGRR